MPQKWMGKRDYTFEKKGLRHTRIAGVWRGVKVCRGMMIKAPHVPYSGGDDKRQSTLNGVFRGDGAKIGPQVCHTHQVYFECAQLM